MIVIRFKARCRPERATEFAAALEAVIAPSRKVDGVINFDIARDLSDPNTFVAVEVFTDREAVNRQDSLPEAAAVMRFSKAASRTRPNATCSRSKARRPWSKRPQLS